MSKYLSKGFLTFFIALVFVFSLARKGSAASLKDIPVSAASEINY
jgi:hypothetical protein